MHFGYRYRSREVALAILGLLLSCSVANGQGFNKPQDYPFLGMNVQTMLDQMGEDYEYNTTPRGLRQYTYGRKHPDKEKVELDMDMFATCGDVVMRHSYLMELSNNRALRSALEGIIKR